MKVIHYGDDYCQLKIGKHVYEIPIYFGKAVERQNKVIKKQRKEISNMVDERHKHLKLSRRRKD